MFSTWSTLYEQSADMVMLKKLHRIGISISIVIFSIIIATFSIRSTNMIIQQTWCCWKSISITIFSISTRSSYMNIQLTWCYWRSISIMIFSISTRSTNMNIQQTWCCWRSFRDPGTPLPSLLLWTRIFCQYFRGARILLYETFLLLWTRIFCQK